MLTGSQLLQHKTVHRFIIGFRVIKEDLRYNVVYNELRNNVTILVLNTRFLFYQNQNKTKPD